MQTDHREVYKITAKRTGKSEQFYKDIQNFVFTEVSHLLKKPNSLILKLKGLGAWHLRRKRIQTLVDKYSERLIPKTREDFHSDKEYHEYVIKKETYLNFQERLKEYEEYIEVRNQTRSKRYENQVLLEPDKGEDQRFKSS